LIYIKHSDKLITKVAMVAEVFKNSLKTSICYAVFLSNKIIKKILIFLLTINS
jgi:hypothetical protein